jgi:hypothetical protein
MRWGHGGWPRKLTDAQVLDIREWYEKVQALPTGLDKAREHNIDTSLLYRIGRRISYKTLQGGERG